MIHNDREEFMRVLETASAASGFPLGLLEKDYYITLLLGNINSGLDENLVFKGGTCLNKLYFDYFRLSEDMDFTMLLPKGNLNKKGRSSLMAKVKTGIKKYLSQYGLRLDESQKPGRNESRQYVYVIEYDSLVTGAPARLKFEIGLRANPLLPLEVRKVKHLFKNPFTNEQLMDGGEIRCLSLMEIAAEKIRAACTRLTLAPRDLFDLDFFIKMKFDFKNKDFLELAGKKLKEDGFEGDIRSYLRNLNRSDVEIEAMKAGLEDELHPVLTVSAAKGFDAGRVIEYFNKISEL